MYGVAAAILAATSGHARPIAHVGTYLALFACVTILVQVGLSVTSLAARGDPRYAVSLTASATAGAEVFLQGHLRIASAEPWTSANHLWLFLAGIGGGTLVFLAVRRWLGAPGPMPDWYRARRTGAVGARDATCTLLFIATLPLAWSNLMGLPPIDLVDDGYSARAPKNVLLITIDTLRSDHLSQYGYEEDTSSSLDGFGFVRFDRAFSTANWTKPATASLLTGTYPSTHSAVDYESVLPPDALTITEVARGLGLATGYCSANINASAVFGLDQGARFSTGDPTDPPDPLRGTTLGDLLRKEVRQIDRATNLNRYALSFLRESVDRRFFLYVHYNDPHTPYDPADPCHPPDDEAYRGRVLLRPPADGSILPAEREHMIARYDGEIRSAVDAAVELLETLERREILDDTLVILTADHGEAFDDHGLWSHGNSTYEELVHIPLLIRPPGRLATAASVDVPVSQVDLMPTILDYLDVPPAPQVAGHSLRPLIESRAAPTSRELLTECHWNSEWGVRDSDYKVIVREVSDPPTLEMYAPRSDPDERQNLIHSPKHRAIGERLIARGAALRAAFDARGLKAIATDLDEEVERELRELGYAR